MIFIYQNQKPEIQLIRCSAKAVCRYIINCFIKPIGWFIGDKYKTHVMIIQKSIGINWDTKWYIPTIECVIIGIFQPLVYHYYTYY